MSITIDHDTPDTMSITGLLMAARAHRMTDPGDAQKVLRLLPPKYPDAPATAGQRTMPAPDQVALNRVVREANSVTTVR